MEKLRAPKEGWTLSLGLRGVFKAELSHLPQGEAFPKDRAG